MLFLSVLLSSVGLRGLVVPLYISCVCECGVYVYVHRGLTMSPKQEAVYDHSCLLPDCLCILGLSHTMCE